MKKEIKEKTLRHIPTDFDGVVFDLKSKLENSCPKAKIISAAGMQDLETQEAGSVDMAVCLKLHKFDCDKAIDEIHRILKPDGTFIACLKPHEEFRTALKEKFHVNSYHTSGHYAYFEAQKK